MYKFLKIFLILVLLTGGLFLTNSQLWAICKTSTKKGVGGPISTHSPALANKIGVSWWYNWQHWNLRSFDMKAEFVPMIRPCPYASCTVYDRTKNEITSTGRQLIQSVVNKRGVGGYWLIGNEPELEEQDNLQLPDAQARIYKEITDAIKQYDPFAKIIIGGWLNADPSRYGQPSTIKRRWLDFDPIFQVELCDDITGWHFHHYVYTAEYASDHAFSIWQQRTDAFINHLESLCPGKEIWITETGSLNEQNASNLIRLMGYLLPYFENHPRITRYGWFYWHSNVLDFNMLGLTKDGQLTEAGLEYGKYGDRDCGTEPPALPPAQCANLNMYAEQNLLHNSELLNLNSGTKVRFYCSANHFNPATDIFEYRLILPNHTVNAPNIKLINQNTAEPQFSDWYLLPENISGDYQAQCRVCRSGVCQAW